jgi:hypothetical protein
MSSTLLWRNNALRTECIKQGALCRMKRTEDRIKQLHLPQICPASFPAYLERVLCVVCRSSAVKEFTQDQLALMRTQDVAYLRRAVQAETAVCFAREKRARIASRCCVKCAFATARKVTSGVKGRCHIVA